MSETELEKLARLEKEYFALRAKVEGSGAAAIGDGATAVGQGGMLVEGDVDGVVVQGDNNNVSLITDSKEAQQQKRAEALTRYLTHLKSECDTLPLQHLQDKTGGTQKRIALSDLYIELDTEEEMALPKTKEDENPKKRAITALEKACAEPHLLILGAPGGGKSSFVRQLVANMAKANLYGTSSPLPGEPLLPVLITVRALNEPLSKLRLQGLPTAQREEQLRQLVLNEWQRQSAVNETNDLPKSFLLDHLLAGQGLLVFDGLDELSEQARFLVAEAMEAWARKVPTLRILGTCRTRSHTADLLSPFHKTTLAPFTRTKIDAFITAWYNAQHQQKVIPDRKEADEKIKDLQQAAKSRDLFELAQNPMLLTTMAIVHQADTRLPTERVRLYKRAVEVLLYRWQMDKKSSRSPELTQLLANPAPLQKVLNQLAYKAHKQQETKGEEKDLTRYDILSFLEADPIFRNEKTTPLGLAEQFLDYVDQRAGLLIGHGGNEASGIPATYSFPHRTFQEYLAGCYMVTKDRNPSRFYRQHMQSHDYWLLPAELGAEQLLYNNDQGHFIFLDLIYGLCPAAEPNTVGDWRSIIWSGRMATLLPKAEITADKDTPDGGESYLNRLTARMVHLLEDSPVVLALTERAAAGRVLAYLGDPREGVGVKDGLPDIVWGEEVPAGTYTIGASWGDSGEKVRQGVIKQPYRLARYPITQAQFAAFEQAADWDDKRWWQGLPEGEKRFNPSAFPYANHPRERVSWYQAVAFCRWLNAKLAPTGYEISLPTEEEWEAAARYHHGKDYPWGETWDSAKANTVEEGVGSTTAVGSYPQGANTALGLYDMSGNVWEWCLNKYEHPDDTAIDQSNDDRVVRGGSWASDQDFARAASRLNLRAGLPLLQSRPPPPPASGPISMITVLCSSGG